MADTVVLDGELSLIIPEVAECDLDVVEDGEAGMAFFVGEEYPEYGGPVEVTPTETTQTLETAGTIVGNNVTVKPIPGNYNDTSDADATDDDILFGKIAYADGERHVGTYPPTLWIGLNENNSGEWSPRMSYADMREAVEENDEQGGYINVNCSTSSAFHYNNTAIGKFTYLEWTDPPRTALGFDIFEYWKESGHQVFRKTFYIYDENGFVKDSDVTFHEQNWMGIQPEFVKNLYSEEYTLNNTLYNGWTPSTTAKAIVAAVTLPDTYAGDLGNYDYYLRWKFDSDIQYNAGTTMKYATLRNLMELWQVIAKRPSSRANIQADAWNGNNCSTYFTAGFTDYYDKNGTRTYAWSSSYGFYVAATTATFNDSTTDTPTITIKTPSINARCSTTYFSTARAADVNQSASKVKVTGELWRVKKDSSPSRQMYELLTDLFNDSLIS